MFFCLSLLWSIIWSSVFFIRSSGLGLLDQLDTIYPRGKLVRDKKFNLFGDNRDKAQSFSPKKKFFGKKKVFSPKTKTKMEQHSNKPGPKVDVDKVA